MCLQNGPSVFSRRRRRSGVTFSILQCQSLTGASFKSVDDLKAHIGAYIAEHNTTAEPFVWTKSKVHQRRVKGRHLSEL
jgi:hypothetical protein